MMRRRWALGLLAGLLAGCATGPLVHSTSWLERLQGFRSPTGSDVVQLDVALVERPPVDPFLSKEVWLAADEQAVSLERKAVLEENGFRVGQIGGLAPAGLQKLLTSDQSCVNPRRLYLHAGNATTLVLGPVAAHCRFRLAPADGAAPVTLEQAEYLFRVVPTLTADGQTRLQFTPQIRHGDKVLMAHASGDGTGVLLQTERPVESYAGLDWEVALAPNQYLIVGARTDRPESLGYQCFIRRDEPLPVQRLLVIRTTRSLSEGLPEVASDPSDEDGPRNRTPPLALQAAWTPPSGSGR